jgi:glycerol-3-phosphate acyltransferase PlsY
MTVAQQQVAVLVPVAYLLGSIPFGLIVGKSKGIDPRTAGSGNIGATNVGRLLGTKFFAIVFVLDLLKGMLPMLAAAYLLREQMSFRQSYLLCLAVGAAAICGHMFSVFLGFKGGKGVATSAGVLLGFWPYYTLPGLVAGAVWVVAFKVWRYVSLASILGAVAFPVAYVCVGAAMGWEVLRSQLPLLIFAVAMAALITYKHRTNIARLRAGTELRAGHARQAPPSA